MDYVEVDGSQGEGGGQILRSAVSFSAILGRPVRVVKIRAGRDVPGLKRQHVSALKVLARVFGGEARGATEGSSEVTFVPGGRNMESLSMDMGTAASITLVLQAVIPAVALTGSRLSLDLVGGTDVPWSPTLDYFDRVVRKAYQGIGMRFEMSSSRRGYYPRGGGRVRATVEPAGRLAPLDITEKADPHAANLVSRCGSLPRQVAERQASSARKVLEDGGVRVLSQEIDEGHSDSPGSSILAYQTGDGLFVGSDSLGARGKPAELVGSEAAGRFLASVKSGARLDSNLADMLLPLLSLAGGPSRVRVPEVTEHLKSGMQLAAQFTSCRWTLEESGGSSVVRVVPADHSGLGRHNV